MSETFIIAEIGINHNGDLDLAYRLVNEAADAGADAVKFQKRTVEKVYSQAELDAPRESPFGTTNGDLKGGLELSRRTYDYLENVCSKIGLKWFASPWDLESVDFLAPYDPKFIKIPSALIVDHELIAYAGKFCETLILSTGMSTREEIEDAVEVGRGAADDLWIAACTSIYPCPERYINLRYIETLEFVYPDCRIGYSGHEKGIATSVAAVALGATFVERHFTLDRTMYGSDQSASLEPQGFAKMVRDIRAVEEAMGDGVKHVWPGELPAKEKLRRINR